MKEKIFFRNNLDQRLVGILHHSENKKPAGAIIICHGFNGHKDQEHLVKFSNDLEEAGFIVLRFDFSYTGESEGTRENITISQGVADLKAAVDYLIKKSGLTAEKVGLLGHSLGGSISTIYCSEDHQIRTLVSTSAASNFRETLIFRLGSLQGWEKKGYAYFWDKWQKNFQKVNYKFCREALDLKAEEILKKINCPFLIIHGEGDKLIPLKHSEELFSFANQPKEYLIIKGADHGYSRIEHLEMVSHRVKEWFKKYL